MKEMKEHINEQLNKFWECIDQDMLFCTDEAVLLVSAMQVEISEQEQRIKQLESQNKSGRIIEGLKVLCVKCGGKGVVERNEGSGLGVITEVCDSCKGKRYFDPPQEVLGAIECYNEPQILESVEIADAVRYFFDIDVERHSMALESGGTGKVIAFDVEGLIKWFRNQKNGGK